jgi:hypothetical protein
LLALMCRMSRSAVPAGLMVEAVAAGPNCRAIAARPAQIMRPALAAGACLGRCPAMMGANS